MSTAQSSEELYGLPLEEFTSARDDLAARLKKEGEAEEAKSIKSLRKPTLPAWTVNQLARREAETLHRLMELRDEMADATGPEDIRRLAGERKHATAALLKTAEEILEEAGHSSGASTLDAVARTLQAGASDDDRVRLLQGILDRPLSPSGFEGFGGFDAFQPTGEKAGDDAPSNSAALRKAEKLANAAAEAERAAHELARRAEDARKQAETLEMEAESARRKAERARKKADDALDAASG